MSEEDLEKLFIPFYRGDNQSEVPGYGIGMTLTHKIITLHQGSILVESVKGKGTTYIVELPHI